MIHLERRTLCGVVVRAVQPAAAGHVLGGGSMEMFDVGFMVGSSRRSMAFAPSRGVNFENGGRRSFGPIGQEPRFGSYRRKVLATVGNQIPRSTGNPCPAWSMS